VIALPSGATAFVIGDVVGHGVAAATTMAEVRTAIRAYALLELPPSQLLVNVSQLTTIVSDRNFATCFYAVHDPAADTLTYASAGHLPAVLIRPDSEVEQIGEAMAQPLGVGTRFSERQVEFSPGCKLVLYTDGLVEARTRDLTEGIERLLAGLDVVQRATDTARACDELIQELTYGRHDDDIAFVHVHHTGSGRR
jgi:serine phosphatase RsbU (regulator of sigma subunit)